MSKSRSTAPGGIDPRSATVLLLYAGGPTPSGVPHRDLHGGDLGRIAYLRALRELEDGRSYLADAPEVHSPGPASAETIAALYAELVGSGAFVPAEPANPEEPAGTPAEEPEA